MKLRLGLLLLLPLLCAGSPVDGDETSAAPLHSRLVEAAKAQKTLRRRLVEGISFTYRNRSQIEFFDKAPKTTEQEWLCVYSYPCMAMEGAYSGDEYAERVRCFGEAYAFELGKRPSTTNWFVKDIGIQDSKGFLLQGAYEGLYDLSLEELYTSIWIRVLDIYGMPVDRFFSQKGIVVDQVDDDGASRVAVTFHGNAQTPTGYDRVLGGTVWLSPERSWAVDEYDLKIDISGDGTGASRPVYSRVHRKVEWTEADGLPVPTSVTDRYSGRDELQLKRLKLPTKVENRWQYGDWTVKRHDADRFRLSHYGLPEPGLPSQSISRGLSWLLWATLAGFVLIVLGVVLRGRLGQGA